MGLGNGDVEMLLPVEIGKHFCDDRLFVYGNVGFNVVLSGPGENSWIYGAAAEWQKTEKLGLVFEVAGVAFEGDSEPDYAFFNAGLMYKLTDHLALIGSAGRAFPERSCGAPVLLTFLGIQITTGGGQADSAKPSPDSALPDTRIKRNKP